MKDEVEVDPEPIAAGGPDNPDTCPAPPALPAYVIVVEVHPDKILLYPKSHAGHPGKPSWVGSRPLPRTDRLAVDAGAGTNPVMPPADVPGREGGTP